MKKLYAYESLAAVAAFFGVVLVVSGLMPFINPEQVDLRQTGEYSPRMLFLVPTLLSLPIFGVSWRLNTKAQEIRRAQKVSAAAAPAAGQAPAERKLKWFLFGIVALLVIYAFLW